MEGRVVSPGPYRATKLWNEVTKYFRAEMPRRKHRQHFKKYGNCFTAAEAISWLHELLRNNNNFGPEVTRQQTIQLLRKFLKNHVIEDIKGRWGSENLDDNHNLYRFPSASPVKILPRRHPLSESTENRSKESESVFKLPQYSRKTPKKYNSQECQENKENVQSETIEDEKGQTAFRRQITQADIEEVWRNIIMIHLQTILGIPSLEEVLNPAQVVPQYITYNMTNTSKRGVVLLQDKSEDLPHWVLSAMKCLANWPRSNDMGHPTYVGFERDVFKTVADYFLRLPEPLLTFQYYELFVNILVLCGYITIPNKSSGKSGTRNDMELSKPPHLNSFKSTECLLLSLLRRETDQKDRSDTSETASENCSAEKGCGTKLQYYPVACKHAAVHELTSGSCQNLSRLQNEQAPSLKLKARCLSLEGIGETTSSKCSKDGLKTLSQAGIHIRPFARNQNQLLHSEYKPNSLFNLCPDNISQREINGFRRISSSNCRDQVLPSTDCKSKQLRRSQSLCGSSNCSWCGIHAPVAEIIVKPHPVVPLGQKTSSITKVNSLIGGKPGDSDMAINKRLCKSATQLSENTFPPSSFMLTGTSHLLQPHLERVAIEALQICCLLLPPPNRRKLQLLMRMISRMSENVDMPLLHDAMGNRSLMIQTFSRCVLCCAEEVDLDELLAIRLVSFLMDHHQEILEVPTYLQVAVQDHIETLKTTQVEHLGDELSTIFPTYSFCKRITSQEFDEQRIYTSQAAIAELLENIIKDKHLSLKDKKKKLKQFQKEYPQIYRDRFPTTESEAILFEDKPKIKQPMLSLRKPKFRTLRN
ncbi:DEP domain-containing protein 1A isoform X2 [Sceloporus undulatus]|uniref:DEP domain-containing protein 1A isoform X2 n=1 Tax=Sceloporus undulatus TaxID=8520 RepID=UPI001C4C73A6|nr:DEP domain-containing protein 1A isoform X2 [Sceloporus undulatus]